MRLLVQAIITGFGLKLGADIYKYFKDKVGIFPDQPSTDTLEEGGAAAQN